jgi:hypothetical protein
MSATATGNSPVSAIVDRTRGRRTNKPPRFFYPSVGVLFLALTIIGFHHFYLSGKSYPGREITPPIRMLVISHGVAMLGWILIFTLQPLLVAKGNLRAHMTIGKLAAFFAAGLVTLGLLVAIYSARVSPPQMKLWTLSPKPFMAVPFFTLLFFGLYVGIGVWKRKRPEIHRPMMMIATLAALGAGISRITMLNNLYMGTAVAEKFGPFVFTAILGMILLAVKCALTRSFDRWMALALSGLLLMSVVVMPIARSGAWNSFAGLLVP